MSRLQKCRRCFVDIIALSNNFLVYCAIFVVALKSSPKNYKFHKNVFNIWFLPKKRPSVELRGIAWNRVSNSCVNRIFLAWGGSLTKTKKNEKYHFGKQTCIFFESLSYIFKCAVWFGRMNDHNRVISRGFSNVFIHIHKVS